MRCFNLGKYTMELGQIEKHGGKIFDFYYPFYDESHRCEFERKFLLHFKYDEIGFETLDRFKYYLQDTLTTNHEKYLHYYKTKLKSQELQWWNNKDYHTEYNRVLDTLGNSTNTSNSNSTTNSTFNANNYDSSTSMSKYSDTPQGSVDNILDEGYYTNVTADNNETHSNSNGKSDGTSNNNSTSTNNSNGKDTETIITNEYGNIGTTSSGDLVKSWLEDAYINIDLMIMNDCKDLFMQIF